MFGKSKNNLVFIIKKQNNYLKWFKKNRESYDSIIFYSKSDNIWNDISFIKTKYLKKIKKYKTISFIDSNVIFNGDLEKYLDVFNRYNLQYASPSYKSSDFFSPNDCLLRYVNYIPIKFITFSFSSFYSLDEIFTYNETGSGIDWVIPKLLDYEGVAIIDQFNVEGDHKEDDKKFVVGDLIKIYNEFELSSFYNVEFDRIDSEEFKDSFCNIKLINLSNIKKMKFSRPTRRSNGCLDQDAYLSDRMMMSTGGPWMP